MILKNKKGDELCLYCDCGCGNGMIFSARVWPDGDGWFSLSTQSSDFYTMQDGLVRRIGEKIKRIWYILRNKEYSYCEVCFKKEDIYELKEYIDQMAEVLKDAKMD